MHASTTAGLPWSIAISSHLFSSWFNRGFLCCAESTGRHRPRSWKRSSATRRCTRSATGTICAGASIPPDRRCYAFFHPALVDEPLIFVEVALTREHRRRDRADPCRQARAHVETDKARRRGVLFDLQLPAGPAGVSFGNFLIKQVVEEVSPRAAAYRDLRHAVADARISQPGSRRPTIRPWRRWPRAARRSAHDESWGGQSESAARARKAAEPPPPDYFLSARTPGRPGRSIRSRASISATARGSSASTGWATSRSRASSSPTA